MAALLSDQSNGLYCVLTRILLVLTLTLSFVRVKSLIWRLLRSVPLTDRSGLEFAEQILRENDAQNAYWSASLWLLLDCKDLDLARRLLGAKSGGYGGPVPLNEMASYARTCVVRFSDLEVIVLLNKHLLAKEMLERMISNKHCEPPLEVDKRILYNHAYSATAVFILANGLLENVEVSARREILRIFELNPLYFRLIDSSRIDGVPSVREVFEDLWLSISDQPQEEWGNSLSKEVFFRTNNLVRENDASNASPSNGRHSLVNRYMLYLTASISLLVPYLLTVVIILGTESVNMLLAAVLGLCSLLATRPVVERALMPRRSRSEKFKLNYERHGLPDDTQVLVVVPILLISEVQFKSAIETAKWNLRISNDSNVTLCFLVDLPDSVTAVPSAEEMLLLSKSMRLLEEANLVLEKSQLRQILLLYRSRVYNPASGLWWGWERKRGKIEEICRMLGGESSVFKELVGSSTPWPDYKYVLCLDEDSRLVRGTICLMAGFLDHPANRPHVQSGLVTAGYGIAVPYCVAEADGVQNESMFLRFSGFRHAATAGPLIARNFQYEFFGEAHFAGKGMFSPSLYLNLCSSAIPENRILSHDTIEGGVLRPAYVEGATVTESSPRTLRAKIDRQDRWIRGDIQNFLFVLKALVVGHPNVCSITIYTVLNQMLAWMTNSAYFFLFVAGIVLKLDLTFFLLVHLTGIMSSLIAAAAAVPHLRTNSLVFISRELISANTAQIYRTLIAPIQCLSLILAASSVAYRSLANSDLMQWRPFYLSSVVNTSRSLLEGYSLMTLLLVMLIGCATILRDGFSSIGALILSGWSFFAIQNLWTDK